MSYSQFSQDQNGVTFAKLNDVNASIRVKQTSAPKTLNGVRVSNFVTEIIAVDEVEVHPTSTVTATDLESLRIRFSSTAEGVDRLIAKLEGLTALAKVWKSEGVMIGFQPKTAPNFDA